MTSVSPVLLVVFLVPIICLINEAEPADLASLQFVRRLGTPSSTSMLLWMQCLNCVQDVRPVNVACWPSSSSPDKGRWTVPVTLRKEDEFVGIALISALESSTRYSYRIEWNTPSSQVRQTTTLEFRTLVDPTIPSVTSFVFGSCLHPGYHPFSVFDHIEQLHVHGVQQPSITAVIGDSIYADAGGGFALTKQVYLDAYHNLLSETKWSRFVSSNPMVTIWDDHEIKNDYDAGKTTGIYASARNAYDLYQAQANPASMQPGELYYVQRLGQTEMFVMDLRSFRSRNKQVDDLNKSILGAKQRQHLLDWLRTSTATVKLIVSSVMWNDDAENALSGKKHYLEGWYLFRHERVKIFAHIQRYRIKGVVLLSGDSHWVGLWKHQLPVRNNSNDKQQTMIYEVSISPMGAFVLPFPKKMLPSSSTSSAIWVGGSSVRTRPDTDLSVYSHVTIDTTSDDPIIDFRVYHVRGKLTTFFHGDQAEKTFNKDGRFPTGALSIPAEDVLRPTSFEPIFAVRLVDSGSRLVPWSEVSFSQSMPLAMLAKSAPTWIVLLLQVSGLVCLAALVMFFWRSRRARRAYERVHSP